MPADAPSPVLLVHGAWHGPWCWERVEAALRLRGIETHTVDLPSCRPQPDGRTTFADDAATVRTVLDQLATPAVVVGHSYGGMVITEGAARHPNVRHLVYLAAFMPDVGEQTLSLLTGAPEPNPALFAALRNGADGWSTVDPAVVHELFYGDCDPEDAALAAAQLRPMRGGNDTIGSVAWKTAPAMYVVATQDRIILPSLQRAMAKRATAVLEWETSHSPFWSRPELLADLLERLAHE